MHRLYALIRCVADDTASTVSTVLDVYTLVVLVMLAVSDAVHLVNLERLRGAPDHLSVMVMFRGGCRSDDFALIPEKES